MNHAVVVVRLDAGHERLIRHRFQAGSLVEAIRIEPVPRSTQISIELCCVESDAAAVVAQLHRCVANGEVGRMGTAIRHAASARSPAP